MEGATPLRKILKYLQKSFIPIIVVIGLIIVQAIADISLPDYTSRIVNIGIQQSGIEYAAPQALRLPTMRKLLLVTEDDDFILDNYRLVSSSTVTPMEQAELVNEYPVFATEDIYLLDSTNQATLEQLDNIFSKAFVVLSALENPTSAQIKAALIAQMPAASTLFTNLSLTEILAKLPAAEQTEMLASLEQKLTSMPTSTLKQMAINQIKIEYQAMEIDLAPSQMNFMFFAALEMLGLALLSMAAAILVTLLAARIAATLGMNMRYGVFNNVLNFSNSEFDTYSTASLITRSTNDIQQVQMLVVMFFRIVVYAPILGIGGITKVLQMNSSMAWIIGIALAAILTLVIVLFSLTMPKFTKLQKLVDKLNLVSREILNGLPVIRAFSTQKYEEKRFDDTNKELTATNLFVNRSMTIMMPTMMLIMNGITILIVWVGAQNIDNGAMQVGDIMTFIQYTMQIVMSFLMLSMVSIMIPRASVSIKRIAEVLNSATTVHDPLKIASFKPEKKGYLEFKNVNFCYPDAKESALCHISFIAPPGKTTAIIGSTGSGKSTLINLIPRFYDVSAGAILLDGVDIRHITQHQLRAKLGFVPQKGVLFSGTIASNIKFGDDNISDEAMQRAAEIAQAKEFISGTPDQYQREISQDGTNVSGGQRQRLAIARAIAKKPEIYIFDDSFSALDYQTDTNLRRALKAETAESTVIIVAQRINTIINAEQIIVLEDGNIVGKGTHKELMQSCEVYKQIATSQLSKEELENE